MALRASAGTPETASPVSVPGGMMGDVVQRSSPVMVGRDEELADLAGLLEGGGCALLSGDAGVGKTRLLMALRDRALEQGWRVRAGACLDFGESALPYLPFSVVVGRFATESPELVERLVGEHPALDRLQPGRRVGAEPDGAPATDRAALFSAVHALLDEAAAETPLLVVIEDVHWADQSTRDLLGYLFSRSYRGRLALVASYRTNDLHRRHPLRPRLAEWTRLPGMRRLSLEPLPDAAVEDLIDRLAPAGVDETTRATIVRRAEGNAFFVEELVASECGGECLPGDLADVLLVGLDRLGDAARQVVRVASVAGRRVSHELLTAVWEADPAELDAGVRQAVEMNVLVADSSSYSFRHALLGEAVYDDLLPGERVRIHQRYVTALSAAPLGTAAELARHAWRARDLDRAVLAGIAAGDEAMAVGGPQDAAHHYERVLDLLGDGDRAERLGIRTSTLSVKAADALTASGDLPRAVALLADRLQRLDAGAAEARAELLDTYAELVDYGEYDLDPVALSAEAVTLAPAGTPLHARVLATYARMLAKRVARGDTTATEPAEAAATEALALAERLGLSVVVSDLVTTMSGLRGGVADLRQALRDALRQAESSGALAPQLRARWLLARSHEDAGEWDEAERWFRSLIDRRTGRDWAPYVLDARWQLAIVRHLRGDWDEALALLAVADAPHVPAIPRAVMAPTRLAIRHARGEDVCADLLSLRSVWPNEGAVAVYSAGVELEVYADRADADAALDVHDRVTTLLEEMWQPRFAAGVRLAAQTLDVLARAAAAASTTDRRRLAADTERIAEHGRLVAKAHQWEVEGRMWVARLAAEHARVRWLLGEDPPTREDLIAAWDAALDCADEMGNVVEGARVRATYSSVLRALGDRDRARELGGAARATAHGLGWVRLLDRLVAAGSRPERPTSEPGRLTEREREVLALVAEGRSNGEIAKLLFISTKTVSVHVSNILGKIGASGRTEAAAIARRNGLIP